MREPPASAGWHPDPWAPDKVRYWDGTTWTASVAEAVPGWAGTERHADDRHDGADRSRARPGRGFFGFWSTVPGLLTAVAAVISAIGGFLITTREDDEPTEPELVVLAQQSGASDLVETGRSQVELGGYTTVTDDSGLVVVDVPAAWNVDGSAIQLDDGTLLPTVTASPDVGSYSRGFEVPGIQVSATDIGVTDIPTAMSALAPAECDSLGWEPYEDSVFEGEIEFFDCAGSMSVYMVLAASYGPDPTQIAVLEGVMTTGEDFDVAVRALETFNFS